MATVDITISGVSVPTDTSAELRVLEDVNGSGGPQSTTVNGTTVSYDNSDTVTLQDGTTSYTTTDVFAGGTGNEYHVHTTEDNTNPEVTAEITAPIDLTVPTAGTPTDTPTQTSAPGDQVGDVGIDLPLQPLSLSTMEAGLSIFLMGVLGLLLGAVALLKNYAAGIMWGMAVLALVLSGVLSIGLELFWTTVAATVALLIVGLIVRWQA